MPKTTKKKTAKKTKTTKKANRKVGKKKTAKRKPAARAPRLPAAPPAPHFSPAADSLPGDDDMGDGGFIDD